MPYYSGKPFAFLDIVPGFNLPVVYGSNPINSRASAVGAPHLLYSYSFRGHDVHFSRLTFPQFIYSDIAPRGGDFFYNYRLKPATATIGGPATVCSSALTQTYSVGSGYAYCDWQATGGTIVARNPAANSVTVAWSGSAATRRLTATPYSRQLARRARMAQASANEQSAAGLDQCSPDEFEAFQSFNAAYNARFGFPFIMAVKGLTRADILAAFQARLANDPQTEFAAAIAQIHRIAGFRLADLT